MSAERPRNFWSRAEKASTFIIFAGGVVASVGGLLAFKGSGGAPVALQELTTDAGIILGGASIMIGGVFTKALGHELK